jgi:hypothetical protein
VVVSLIGTQKVAFGSAPTETDCLWPVGSVRSSMMRPWWMIAIRSA